jgi:hypothetical protein
LVVRKEINILLKCPLSWIWWLQFVTIGSNDFGSKNQYKYDPLATYANTSSHNLSVSLYVSWVSIEGNLSGWEGGLALESISVSRVVDNGKYYNWRTLLKKQFFNRNYRRNLEHRYSCLKQSDAIRWCSSDRWP